MTRNELRKFSFSNEELAILSNIFNRIVRLRLQGNSQKAVGSIFRISGESIRRIEENACQLVRRHRHKKKKGNDFATPLEIDEALSRASRP